MQLQLEVPPPALNETVHAAVLQTRGPGCRRCQCPCGYGYVIIHTYIHTYRHTYIHTYIHTYVHTYIQPSDMLGQILGSAPVFLAEVPSQLAPAAECAWGCGASVLSGANWLGYAVTNM